MCDQDFRFLEIQKFKTFQFQFQFFTPVARLNLLR